MPEQAPPLVHCAGAAPSYVAMCRSGPHSRVSHVPEQHAVPGAVPDQRLRVLSIALAPRSDWRHVLAGACHIATTVLVGHLPGFSLAHCSGCAKFCLPHWLFVNWKKLSPTVKNTE